MNLPTEHFFHDSTCTPDFVPPPPTQLPLFHVADSPFPFNIGSQGLSHENANFLLAWKKRKGQTRNTILAQRWPSAARAEVRSSRAEQGSHKPGLPVTPARRPPAGAPDWKALLSSFRALLANCRDQSCKMCIYLSAHKRHTRNMPVHTRARMRARAGSWTPICILFHFQAEQ